MSFRAVFAIEDQEKENSLLTHRSVWNVANINGQNVLEAETLESPLVSFSKTTRDRVMITTNREVRSHRLAIVCHGFWYRLITRKDHCGRRRGHIVLWLSGRYRLLKELPWQRSSKCSWNRSLNVGFVGVAPLQNLGDKCRWRLKNFWNAH